MMPVPTPPAGDPLPRQVPTLPNCLAQSDCAADALDILVAADAWMTTRNIYDALESRGRIHGYRIVEPVQASPRLHSGGAES